MMKKEKKSTTDQLAEINKKKHADSIKYLYFSRYLFVRYVVTAFLFSNLFWLIFCFYYQTIFGIIVSGAVFIYTAIASLEQLTKMHNRQKDIPITRNYFWVQIIINIILGCLLFIGPTQKILFPFSTTSNVSGIILTILLIGILLALFCEYKIYKILHDSDRYRKVIDTFEKSH